MDSYTCLAGCYDEFTKDVEYQKWAEYLVGLLKKHNTSAQSILDLACGTGTLSLLLAESGFEVIGVDISEDMLAVANQKALNFSGTRPMFIQQDMEKLDLYGTVDAAVCCLDSLNYLTSGASLKRVFGRLKFFVRPDGLFIFDINTESKFKSMDGNTFVRENENVFCVWSADYDKTSRLCKMNVDIFEKNGKLWSRSCEEHLEFAHSHEKICSALDENGFSLEAVYGELADVPPKSDEQRIFYVARRKNI